MNKFIKKLAVLAIGGITALSVGLVGADKAEAATGDKVTSVAGIVDNGNYVIGATVSGTDYYFKSASTVASSASALGQVVSSAAEATPVTLNGSGATWSVKFESGTYLSLKSAKDNGKHLVTSDKTDFTLTDKTNCMEFKLGSYRFQFNNTQKDRFGSYASGQTDVWLEELGASTVLMESITLKADGAEADSISLMLDDMYEGLTAVIAPEAPTDPTIDWTSSNSKVAYYQDGIVYALAAGSATITATAHDGGGATDSIEVFVADPSNPILTSVTVAGTPVTPQFVGNDFNYSGLTFTPVYDKVNENPDVITGADISWPTLIADMATVTGTYKGIDVVVTGVVVKVDTIASIAVSGDMTTKTYNNEETWDPTGLVVTATYESGATAVVTEGITWAYSADIPSYDLGDSKTVTVTATVGTIVSEGYEVVGITIEEAPAIGSSLFEFNNANTHLTADAISKTPATIDGISISVDKNTSSSTPTTNVPIRLYVGFKFTISGNDTIANITSLDIVANSTTYANALAKSTWTPSATVTVNGKNVNVTFATDTKDIVLVIAEQSRLDSLNVNYDKVKIDESAKVETITLSPATVSLDAGDTAILTADVLPGNAFDKTVTWSSSDDAIATVIDGTVTAVAVGSATITATANDGSGVSGDATITVNAAPAGKTDITAKIDGDTLEAGDIAFAITKTGSGVYTGYTSDRGAQFGSSSNDITATFETTGNKFETTGLRVLINASCSGTGTATLKVYVGATQIGETVTLTGTATDYELTPATVASIAAASSDTLKIELANTSGAVYLKSIAVYGEESPITETDKLNDLIALVESLNTCTDYDRAAEARELYNALSAESKAAFDATIFEDEGGSVTLKDKLAYMEMLAANAAAPADEVAPLTNVNDNTLSIALITLVAVLGLSAVAAYYFLNKKKARA